MSNSILCFHRVTLNWNLRIFEVGNIYALSSSPLQFHSPTFIFDSTGASFLDMHKDFILTMLRIIRARFPVVTKTKMYLFGTSPVLRTCLSFSRLFYGKWVDQWQLPMYDNVFDIVQDPACIPDWFICRTSRYPGHKGATIARGDAASLLCYKRCMSKTNPLTARDFYYPMDVSLLLEKPSSEDSIKTARYAPLPAISEDDEWDEEDE
jgi:hypothetical protein